MNQGINFAVARKELNYTQEEMAEKIGISRVTIGNTERGKNISKQYLNYLKDKGYSEEWLRGESEEKKNDNYLSLNDNTSSEFIETLKSENQRLHKENVEIKKENNFLSNKVKELEAKFDKLNDALYKKFLGVELGKVKMYSKSEFVTAKVVRMPSVTKSDTSVLAIG